MPCDGTFRLYTFSFLVLCSQTVSAMGGFDYTHSGNKRKQRLVEKFKHDQTLQLIEVINYDYFILSLICSLPWVLYNIFWRAPNNHWNNRWGAAPHRKCLRELVWIPRSKNGNLWIQRQHWRNKTKCYWSTCQPQRKWHQWHR